MATFQYKSVTVSDSTPAALNTALQAALTALDTATVGDNGQTIQAQIIEVNQGAFVNAASADLYWATIVYNEYAASS